MQENLFQDEEWQSFLSFADKLFFLHSDLCLMILMFNLLIKINDFIKNIGVELRFKMTVQYYRYEDLVRYYINILNNILLNT